MVSLFCRRLALALGLVILASSLTFALIASAPGNAANFLAERAAGPKATHALVEKIEHDLGLNDPLYVRYGHWAVGTVRGQWGESLRTGRPITKELAERLPTTMRLLAGGGVIALVMPLILGLLGAVSNGGPVDRTLRVLALFGASAPNFFVGAMLVLLLSVKLHWLPAFGTTGFASWVMPWITVGLFPTCVLSRVVRVSLQELMSRPFTTTGFAKGYGRTEVLLREALPNLAVPFLTTFGAQFALMIIGAIVVESVFAWQGIGAFFIDSIRFRDFPAMQAVLMTFVTFFVLVNFVVDMLCMAIDPRIRRSHIAGA
ncbi:binding--dependent transport system inner membrane component family protein [Paraburkholderia xenovorans LB400]|uniref:ABC nickel transporter, inner membrane subunit n=1 Tax=Paraburkholderia xenovorans (strain LB400) TaxID=266265 RepID=Q13J75_PARXL|nr:ABC transporter permease [Paraburkholderia xenovorans]ABE35864.1 ABC nickel transporter, inner membrane subunit [Paraburkholderia xenovorans LB400]AIP35299.1 binding--dependent transport system inner membrane component family protein [Paraburkholderia xenovorans LB400]